ncbi:MAG: hypothetical protein ACRBN8_12645 [Nannocystales bacterium]
MLALLIALALAEPVSSPAAPSSKEAGEVPDTVLMLEVGSTPGFDASACVEATEAHAGGSGLNFHRRPLESDSALSQALSQSRSAPTLAVFWFEVRPDVVAIYLYAPQTHAVYVREVERSSDAAVVEAVGLITASTAVALRSGETLAMRKISEQEWSELRAEPESEPEPKTAEPEPESEPEPDVVETTPEDPARALPLEFGAAYRGATFNTEAPWQHGVTGRVGVLVGSAVIVELGYAWMAPANVGGGLDLTRHEPELAAGWRWRGAGRFGLDVLGVGSIELNRWRAGARDGTRVRGRLGGALRASLEVGAGVFFEARLGARVALNAFDFVVCESPDAACTGDAREVVASGWRAAPEALVGLSYRFGAPVQK